MYIACTVFVLDGTGIGRVWSREKPLKWGEERKNTQETIIIIIFLCVPVCMYIYTASVYM